MIEADDDYMAHGVGVGSDDFADLGDGAAADGAAAPKAWAAVDDFM